MDNLLNTIFSDQTSRRIELVGKFFIAIAAAYFVGIIVVNLYLGRFGFYSLSLFRLNYVLAGFWAMLTLALSYVLFELALMALVLLFVKGISFKDRILQLFAYTGGAFIFGCGAYAVAGILGVSIGWPWIVISLIGL